MMRRCITQLSANRSLGRFTKQVTTQGRYLSSSRKEFTKQNGPPTARQNAPTPTPPPPPSSAVNPPESGGHSGKVIVGGIVIGAAFAAAYQSGYFKQSPVKVKSDIDNTIDKGTKKIAELGEKIAVSNNQESDESNNIVEHVEKNSEAHGDIPNVSDLGKTQGESQVGGVENVRPEEHAVSAQQKDLPSFSDGSVASEEDQSSGLQTASEDTLEKKDGSGFTLSTSSTGQNEAVHNAQISQETEPKLVSDDTQSKEISAQHPASVNIPEAETAVANDGKPPNSLLDEYFISEKDGGSDGTSLKVAGIDGHVSHSKEKEDSVGMSEESKDAYISKDGKLVLDFLQAIHAAEEQQAELDAQVLAEEKRILKEKYEKELKDARARELMYAEEAAILNKELNKERTKAAATVKLLQEKAEENLNMELECKEKEAELQLKQAQELAKAQLAAAIASEKASQIEKMAEANLNINALCLAFYARSEEARQNHTVHKLALGTFALEDALSKGLPLQTEIKALQSHLAGIEGDSLLDLVFSSIPEETVNNGADTQLELNQKFDALKEPLRHYSLIPPGGGGILAHTLAHIASQLKVKEDGVSGDGIESVITRVESFLAEGKLAAAADALEGGVSGSQAKDIIGDWVKQARNRAIIEQALSLLKSYAIAASVA